MAVVPLPDPKSKAYRCSCGRYSGNSYGLGVHRSKTQCGGHPMVELELPETAPAGEPAAVNGEVAAVPEPDQVMVAGQAAPGRLVEPKGAAPTTFRAQAETTAELRTYFDYFRAALKYEGDFSTWLEEMARLALRECFDLELIVRIRTREVVGV